MPAWEGGSSQRRDPLHLVLVMTAERQHQATKSTDHRLHKRPKTNTSNPNPIPSQQPNPNPKTAPNDRSHAHSTGVAPRTAWPTAPPRDPGRAVGRRRRRPATGSGSSPGHSADSCLRWRADMACYAGLKNLKSWCLQWNKILLIHHDLAWLTMIKLVAKGDFLMLRLVGNPQRSPLAQLLLMRQ